MKRIILFRFHRDPGICRNRLRLLKKLNPDIQIFGLYGGPEKDYRKIQNRLKHYLEDIYYIQGKPDFWKWAHSDLAVRLWYKEIGKTLSFDMLHVIEWDLLLFDPLDKIYKDIPRDSVGLTSLILLKDVDKNWPWLSKESQKSEWNTLLNFAKDKFNYSHKPYVCQCPGACLPKKFLERYSSIEIPELCHDELRLPLFSQSFGFELRDTRFCKRWHDKREERYFNCLGIGINLSSITEELARPSGRRAFHPFQKVVVFNWFDHVINFSITAKGLANSFRRNTSRKIKRALQE